MGLNKVLAAGLAEDWLAEWRRLPYEQWRRSLWESEERQVIGDDGERYTVRSEAFDDGDGRIRMTVAVDDGGWSSFVPLVRDEIMKPDGTFIE